MVQQARLARSPAPVRSTAPPPRPAGGVSSFRVKGACSVSDETSSRFGRWAVTQTRGAVTPQDGVPTSPALAGIEARGRGFVVHAGATDRRFWRGQNVLNLGFTVVAPHALQLPLDHEEGEHIFADSLPVRSKSGSGRCGKQRKPASEPTSGPLACRFHRRRSSSRFGTWRRRRRNSKRRATSFSIRRRPSGGASLVCARPFVVALASDRRPAALIVASASGTEPTAMGPPPSLGQRWRSTSTSTANGSQVLTSHKNGAIIDFHRPIHPATSESASKPYDASGTPCRCRRPGRQFSWSDESSRRRAPPRTTAAPTQLSAALPDQER